MGLGDCLREIMQRNINDNGSWPGSFTENADIKVYRDFAFGHDLFDETRILFVEIVLIEQSLNALGELDTTTMDKNKIT